MENDAACLRTGCDELPMSPWRAGAELLAEWVQAEEVAEDLHAAVAGAVRDHLAVMRQELRLNMACFAA